jgi:hypothetical protein
VRLDLLLHLYLLMMSLLLVELRSQTSQLLGIVRCLVGFTSKAFPLSLVMVKPNKR